MRLIVIAYGAIVATTTPQQISASVARVTNPTEYVLFSGSEAAFTDLALEHRYSFAHWNNATGCSLREIVSWLIAELPTARTTMEISSLGMNELSHISKLEASSA